MMLRFFLLLIAVLGVSPLLLAQTKQVTGIVTDEAGIPLIGVSVQIKSTTKGVATDFDGNYSIEASKGDVLVFSSVGFSSQEKIVVGGVIH